jgi:hypothetical protein
MTLTSSNMETAEQTGYPRHCQPLKAPGDVSHVSELLEYGVCFLLQNINIPNKGVL